MPMPTDAYPAHRPNYPSHPSLPSLHLSSAFLFQALGRTTGTRVMHISLVTTGWPETTKKIPHTPFGCGLAYEHTTYYLSSALFAFWLRSKCSIRGDKSMIKFIFDLGFAKSLGLLMFVSLALHCRELMKICFFFHCLQLDLKPWRRRFVYC